MSRAPAMPLFCDAYLADTMHLSLEEHGAYLKLLMIIWRHNGQPLPDDDARLARMLGVSSSRWRERLRPVLAPFFDLSQNTWRQHRLEKEWRYVEERIRRARENGAKGGRPASDKTLISHDLDEPPGSAPQQAPAPCGLSPHPQPQTPCPEREESHGREADQTPPGRGPGLAEQVLARRRARADRAGL